MIPIHQQFKIQLQQSGFTGDISDNKNTLQEHACDESIFCVLPELVIYPKTTHDISLAVELAQTLSTPTLPLHLTVRAAGTGLSGGSLNNSIIVNTTRYLNTIHGHRSDHEDIIYDLEPGVMYRDLETIMDKQGVYIPSLPASKDLCAIGGMVGNNTAGPDTLRYGHTARYVESIEVVLSDGHTYTITPLRWETFQKEMERDDQLGAIYRHVWELLLRHEELVLSARPKTSKNSAGYALWDVISTTTEEFMQGRGVFDLTQIFTGSQGTLGIIARLCIRAVPRPTNTHLITIPIFNLEKVGSVISHLLTQTPINIELFDGPTYRAAMDHPNFFRDRISSKQYKKIISYLPWIYRTRFAKQLPHFVLLVTFPDDKSFNPQDESQYINKTFSVASWHTSNPLEREILWQIRRASYSLSKSADPSKRPAAFLEDMAVSPDHMGTFFTAISELFKKYKVQAYVHGHGGDGHLHFYPLLDFTNPATVDLIPQMAQDFFVKATELGGNICGEHNDGIIRTPYLDTIFSPAIIEIFKELEHICDPHNLFNPGKKVNPRFDITQVIRHTNH